MEIKKGKVRLIKKIRVAILFGGKSAEHEVSLLSAKNVIDAIDKNKYDVVLIGVDKQGRWFLSNSSSYLLNAGNPKLVALEKSDKDLAIIPGKVDTQLLNVITKSDVIKSLK